MKKKIVSIFMSVCVLFLSAFAFVGCDLLHDNSKRYYNQVVAKVGTESITRNEVMTMFNYYFYTGQYYQYGYTEEDVYKMVLEALIKNKIMVIEAKKIEECKFTQEDEDYVWEQVFNNINSQLDASEKEIRKTLKAEEEEEKAEEKTKPTIFETYTRTEPGKDIEKAEVCLTKEGWLEKLNAETNKDTNYYRYLAFRNFNSTLLRNSDEYKANKKSAEQVFNDELERLYTYYADSRYVAKYNNYILSKINISNAQIEQAYLADLKAQQQKYESYGDFNADLTNTSTTNLILYRPTEGKFFSVQHILLQFKDYDDKLNASAKLYEEEYYVPSISEKANREEYMIEYYLGIRDDYAYGTGKFEGEENLNTDYVNPVTGEKNKDDDGQDVTYTYSQIDDMIFGTEGIVNTCVDSQSLVDAFFKLKFAFSKDGGVSDLTNLTNLQGYVFNSNKETKNGFVQEFSDTAYELYDEFLADPNAKYGIKKVVTNFGVHYIMFAGEMGTEKLELNSKISLVTNQTVADYYYEKLLSESMSSVQESMTSELYNKYQSEGSVEVFYKTFEDCK